MSSRFNLRQKNITVDSASRSSGTSSNFTSTLAIPHNNEFNKCSVLMAEIPKSYYPLDSTTTNTFLVNAVTVTIPPNVFYTGTSLATACTTALLAALPANVITVTYVSNTGMFKFVAATSTFTLTFTDLLAKYFGFESGTVYTDTALTTNAVNIANLNRYDVLYVRSSISVNNNDDILMTLFPASYPDVSLIAYSTPDIFGASVNVGNNKSNSHSFNIQDINGKNVDLHGVGCRFVISMWNEPI